MPTVQSNSDITRRNALRGLLAGALTTTAVAAAAQAAPADTATLHAARDWSEAYTLAKRAIRVDALSLPGRQHPNEKEAIRAAGIEKALQRQSHALQTLLQSPPRTLEGALAVIGCVMTVYHDRQDLKAGRRMQELSGYVDHDQGEVRMIAMAFSAIQQAA